MSKSSWLIPLFINALVILLSILFNLLVANITILLYFSSYFLGFFNSFFTIPVETENARLYLALVIPTGAPMTVSNDATEMLPLITDKTINDFSK